MADELLSFLIGSTDLAQKPQEEQDPLMGFFLSDQGEPEYATPGQPTEEIYTPQPKQISPDQYTTPDPMQITEPKLEQELPSTTSIQEPYLEPEPEPYIPGETKTQQQLAMETPPEKPGTLEAMGRSAAGGAADLALNFARIPETAAEVYVSLNNYTNKAANKVIELATMGKAKDTFKEVPHEAIPKFLKMDPEAWDVKALKEFSDNQQKVIETVTDSKGIIDHLSNGDFKKAGQTLGVQAAAQIPLILSMGIGGAAGIGAKELGAFAGATESSAKMDSYWEAVDAGMTEQSANAAGINAVVSGAIETIGETMVTGGIITDAIKKLSKGTSEQVAKKAVGGVVGKFVGNIMKSAKAEATEETIVGYSQAVTDMLLGSQDMSFTEAVKQGIEGGLVGFVTAGATTGPLSAYADTKGPPVQPSVEETPLRLKTVDETGKETLLPTDAELAAQEQDLQQRVQTEQIEQTSPVPDMHKPEVEPVVDPLEEILTQNAEPVEQKIKTPEKPKEKETKLEKPVPETKVKETDTKKAVKEKDVETKETEQKVEPEKPKRQEVEVPKKINKEKLISEIKNTIKTTDFFTDRHFLSVKPWENFNKKRIYVKFSNQQRYDRVETEGYIDLDNNTFVDKTDEFYRGSKEHKFITDSAQNLIEKETKQEVKPEKPKKQEVKKPEVVEPVIEEKKPEEKVAKEKSFDAKMPNRIQKDYYTHKPPLVAGDKTRFEKEEYAKPLKLKNADDFDVFIHKTSDGEYWVASEAITGNRITKTFKNKVEAITEAQLVIDKYGDQLKSSIMNAVRKGDISPAFQAKQENVPKEEVKVEINGQKDVVDVAPTEPQKEAGNYKKAHIRRDGMEISIENPVGSIRSGKDDGGREWSQEMKSDYGYIRGTKGKDKDHIDVFIKPKSKEGGTVFVVDQVDPKTGKLDEAKIMLGYSSTEEARDKYLENYEKGWKGIGSITPIDIDGFKDWLKKGNKNKSFADSDWGVKGSKNPLLNKKLPESVKSEKKETKSKSRNKLKAATIKEYDKLVQNAKTKKDDKSIKTLATALTSRFPTFRKIFEEEQGVVLGKGKQIKQAVSDWVNVEKAVEEPKVEAEKPKVGAVADKLLDQKEDLENKIKDIEKAISTANKTDMPGTLVTGRSGVGKGRAKKLNAQIDRSIDRAKELVELQKKLNTVNSKIKFQQGSPKREEVKKGVVQKQQEVFDKIKVGDEIDIGGNFPVKVAKKNKKTVVTENGAKYNSEEILGIEKSEQKDIDLSKKDQYSEALSFTQKNQSNKTNEKHKVESVVEVAKNKNVPANKKQAIMKANSEMSDYIQRNPGKNKGSGWLGVAETFYWKNKALEYPIIKLRKILEKSTKIKDTDVLDDIDFAIDRVRGSQPQAELYIKENLEPIFENALKGRKDRAQIYRQLVDYLVAKRTVWRYENQDNYEDAGISEKKANTIVNYVESGMYSNSDIVTDMAQKIWDYTSELKNLRNKGGLIDDELMLNLREPNYVPFYRDIEKNKIKTGGGTRFTSIATHIKKMKGTKKELRIIDPILSIAQQTADIIEDVNRAAVMQGVVKTAEKYPDILGGLVEAIKPKWVKVGTIEHRVQTDAVLRPALDKLAEKIGIKIVYKSRLGTKRLEVMNEFKKEIKILYGATESIYAHGLGHALDHKYSWISSTLRPFSNELEAIADSRYEGHAAPPKFVRYVRQLDEKVAEFISLYVSNRYFLQSIAPHAVKAFEAKLAKSEIAELKDIVPSNVKTIESHEDANMVQDTSIRQDEDVVAVRIDGKIKQYRLPAEMALSIKNMHPEQLNQILKVIFSVHKVARAAFVTHNPNFFFPNFNSDQLDAMFNKNNVPYVDGLIGLKAFIEHGELYKLYIRRGGGMNSIEAGVTGRKHMLADLIYGNRGKQFFDSEYWNETGVLSGTKDATGLLVDTAFKPIIATNEALEMATRIGVAIRTWRRRGINIKDLAKGKIDIEAKDISFIINEGINAGRHSSIDYARYGYSGIVPNQVFLFWNAILEGVDKFSHTWKDHPVRSAAYASMMLMIYAGLTAWNRRDEFEELYKAIPVREKEMYHILMLGLPFLPYLKLKKSHAEKMIINPMQMIYEKVEGLATTEWKDIAINMFNEVSPINESNMIPIPLKLILEPMIDYDLFWKQDIEGAWRKAVQPKPGLRYNARTSEVMKKIGKAINISPIMMQHEINAMLGGSGQSLLWVADWATGSLDKNYEPKFEPSKTIVLKRYAGKLYEWRTDASQMIRKIDIELGNISRAGTKTSTRVRNLKRLGYSDVKNSLLETNKLKRNLLAKKRELENAQRLMEMAINRMNGKHGTNYSIKKDSGIKFR